VVFVAGSQYTSRWLRFSNHELTAMLAALADPGLLRDLGRRGETHRLLRCERLAEEITHVLALRQLGARDV